MPPSNLKPPHDSGTPDLVQLDRDHPGFRDPIYRARRNAIAQSALAHRIGEPIAEVAYTDTEHGVWEVALEHLAPLHARYACHEFVERWPAMGFALDRIPSFSDVNARLAAATGFRLSPVAGLVTPRHFMSHLADRVFLATQYIRHHSAPLYTPEPDIVHEMVGHAALLADPDFARVNEKFGHATRRADEATVLALIRVYWFALEFGVVRAPTGLAVVGAGLLSSYGELGRFETQSVLHPFDLGTMSATPFDPTDYQNVLFVGRDSRTMLAEVEDWLDELIAR